ILQSKFTPDLTGAMSLQQIQLDIQQAIAHKDVPFESVLDEIERHGQLDIPASLTVTYSTQGIAPIPGWELVEMQTKQQHWDDISAELYAPETPLEFYLEMSKPMRVMVNYGIDRYTEESIAQLLASYESILVKLAIDPEISISKISEIELK
ncbi:MAG: hypothetical protein LH613_16195, partial [Chamaesiphon sp.]|nr:hypothetical protein [Chamaesiphon sp.]